MFCELSSTIVFFWGGEGGGLKTYGGGMEYRVF